MQLKHTGLTTLALNKCTTILQPLKEQDWVFNILKYINVYQIDSRKRNIYPPSLDAFKKRKASIVQAADGGVMVFGILSQHSGPFSTRCAFLNWHTPYLSIVACCFHEFMTTVFSCCNGYLQQNNASYYKVQVMSDWFVVDNEFTVPPRPPGPPDLKTVSDI